MPNLAYHDVNRKVKTLTETQECVDLATNKWVMYLKQLTKYYSGNIKLPCSPQIIDTYIMQHNVNLK